MDVSVILTYRCNSKCSMCDVWKHPTAEDWEVGIEELAKLPDGIDYLNLTGGEPTLRRDLREIVDLLHGKAKVLEISTNGLRADPLVAIVRQYPDVKIRISLEGLGETNDIIRGERGGYRKKLETMEALIKAGGCDLGFAITFQDANAGDLLDIYELARGYGVELATSALHNGFQFHKGDNEIAAPWRLVREIEKLIVAMLRSRRVKDWFRAYLNLGLIRKILGFPRLLPCEAGSTFAFVDPWGDVYACNVRQDLFMGSLRNESWDSIWTGERAQRVRRAVSDCGQNCWMVASAKTAMRIPWLPRAPRPGVLWWVLVNKMRLAVGRRIPFERYVAYDAVGARDRVPCPSSYLGVHLRRAPHRAENAEYEKWGPYVNE